MAETGHHQTYDSQGNVIEDSPFVITADQELLLECAKEANDYHVLALQALRNWGSLTLEQKDKILQFLLRYYLTSAQRLGYFTL